MRAGWWIVLAGLVVGSPMAKAQPARGGGAEPSAIAPGAFLAADGTVRDFHAAYRDLTARRRPHYLRGAIELGGLVAGGTTWYWLDRERQVADWDYPSWRQRITFEAWRFDNNPFGINFLWHAINGTGFHLVARSNDLGLLGAVGYGFATSMVWEYFLEFREKISINDVLVTPGSGIAMGEFFFWLGRYLQSPNPRLGAAGQVARWSAGLPQSFHDHLDGPTRPVPPDADALGFRTDIYHRFDLWAGLIAAATGREVANATVDRSLLASRVDFAGRLVALPGYLRPGDFAVWFRDGNVTALDLSIVAGGEGTGVDLGADTILVGRHRQRIPAGEGVGYALTLGTSIGYHYRRQDLGEFHDRLGILHLPGLAADAAVVGRRVQLVAFARLHGDFAGIGALAYDTWQAAHPDEVGKTVLRKYGYYYGWGGSGRLGAELRTSRLAVGGRIALGRYFSQEGLDRNQEELTADVTASDRVVDAAGWLRARPLGGRFALELRFGHQGRRGHVGGVDGRAHLDSVSLHLGATL